MEWVFALSLCLAALLSLQLSLQMPVYAARLIGQEPALNQLWAAMWQDGLAGRALFIMLYLAIGFSIWAVPISYVVATFHPKHGPAVRRRTSAVVRHLLVPLRPLFLLIERKYDEWNGELIERRTLKNLYKREFSQQFPAFGLFYNYYKWLNDRHYNDPIQPLTTFADPFQDAEALLGLKSGYSAQDLAARYRALMKQVHPDVAPPSDLARRLTEARDLLKARKGWR